MMCSFLYPPRTSLLEPFGGNPAPFHKIDAEGDLVESEYPGLEVLFYNDIFAEEAARCKALLNPHSWHSKPKLPSPQRVGW